MKNRKISESILNRSVLKLITNKNKSVVTGGAAGQDCSVIDAGDCYILTSTECALTGERLAPYFAVMRAANNIAACGGTPIAASAAFILREDFDEKRLKDLTRLVNDACGECKIQLSGGHSELCDGVNQDMVTVTVTGTCHKSGLLSVKNAKSGMAVIQTGWIAMEETAYLYDEHKSELLEKLPAAYVDRAREALGQACLIKTARIAADNGAIAMHDVAQKGIFAALWELSARSGCGLDIDLRAIPVRQETIEFCEIMGLNPYEEASVGSMLIVTEKPGMIIESLALEGVSAAAIGYLTSDNDKKLVYGDEVRYIDKP